jgi:hypothetical protein
MQTQLLLRVDYRAVRWLARAKPVLLQARRSLTR